MRRVFKMSVLLEKIIQNNEMATSKLKLLKHELEDTKRELIIRKKEQYLNENAILLKEIENTKAELINLEKQNGKLQISIPGDTVSKKSETDKNIVVDKKQKKQTTAESANPIKNESTTPAPSATKPKSEKKKEKTVANNVPDNKTGDDVIAAHVGMLDMRIGKIIEISRHPDADSLYLEKIDCGENAPRTVISGLVKFVPIEEMKDRLVVILCNLKPAKMRGIVSEAMVMCASTPEKVEVLSPPLGSEPGDLVHCEGYNRDPPKQLNPKKKIFETVAPDLKTNSNLIACYKDSPLFVPGKGNIVAQTLSNVNIK